ncbi:hypothetical protein B0H16DRAFT_1466437 [Mycena metata]|uniref:Uncharacterized protein n=1 Tax=Mycena metata TaxID=1033252 RepID=A0AAD7I995_9AGAR|nr:hypothetical protein B0H16DRAFT_1466437 [Mycena metata]
MFSVRSQPMKIFKRPADDVRFVNSSLLSVWSMAAKWQPDKYLAQNGRAPNSFQIGKYFRSQLTRSKKTQDVKTLQDLKITSPQTLQGFKSFLSTQETRQQG